MAITAIGPQGGDPAKRPVVNSRLQSIVRTRKVAILGFGTVGTAVAELLCQTPGLPVELTHVFNRNIARKRVSWLPKHVEWTDDLSRVLVSDVDVVVELVGGLEPARQWLQQALLAGKSVVTANKHLMAVHGLDLLRLARQTGQQIAYGASVAGGVPVLNALANGLAADRLLKVAGVLNGTCNYILSNMESHGTCFTSSLRKVQNLGFAEADPSDDIRGIDASCKLAIVARVGLHAAMHPEAISRQSIEGIEPIDFEYARQLGCTIRQVSIAEIRGRSLLAAVQPMLVPFSSPLSRTKDSENALIVTGQHGGQTVFSGRGAGGGPTAVAVVSDLLALAHNVPLTPTGSLQAYRVSGNFLFPYLLRVHLQKQSQSVPAITHTLSGSDVRIEALLRKPAHAKSRSVALVLKPCRTAKIQKAVEQLRALRGMQESVLCLPLLRDGKQ
jgi:homoserine dehydrogenase